MDADDDRKLRIVGSRHWTIVPVQPRDARCLDDEICAHLRHLRISESTATRYRGTAGAQLPLHWSWVATQASVQAALRQACWQFHRRWPHWRSQAFHSICVADGGPGSGIFNNVPWHASRSNTRRGPGM